MPKKTALLLMLLFVSLLCLLDTSVVRAAEIPNDAKRHMYRGEAAMEEAKDASGYQDAVAEFKKAVEYAPDWAIAWFSLGVAQEANGDYKGAMKSFNKYLELNPLAENKDKIEGLIYKLEYKAEQKDKAALQKKVEAPQTREAKRPWTEKLNGRWLSASDAYTAHGRSVYDPSSVYKIQVNGNQITIRIVELGITNFTHSETRSPQNYLLFKGQIEGHRATGAYFNFSHSGKVNDKLKVFGSSQKTKTISLSDDGKTLYFGDMELRRE